MKEINNEKKEIYNRKSKFSGNSSKSIYFSQS
jgi:hypothetical protein